MFKTFSYQFSMKFYFRLLFNYKVQHFDKVVLLCGEFLSRRNFRGSQWSISELVQFFNALGINIFDAMDSPCSVLQTVEIFKICLKGGGKACCVSDKVLTRGVYSKVKYLEVIFSSEFFQEILMGESRKWRDLNLWSYFVWDNLSPYFSRWEIRREKQVKLYKPVADKSNHFRLFNIRCRCLTT